MRPKVSYAIVMAPWGLPLADKATKSSRLDMSLGKRVTTLLGELNDQFTAKLETWVNIVQQMGR